MISTKEIYKYVKKEVVNEGVMVYDVHGIL